MVMLTKKMLRDMGEHKTQFISIFLMAFLAVYIYAGVGSEWVGLRHSVDDFYTQTNLADIFLYGSGFDSEAERNILSVPGVTDAERRLDISAVAELAGNPRVELHFVERNEISALYLVEGGVFDSRDADGVWLDKRFADARGLTLGDSITLTYNGFTLEQTIRGLIYSAEYVYRTDGEGITPDFNANGCAYLSHKAFPFPDMMVYSVLLIKTDSHDLYELEDRISDALDGGYSVFLPRENHASANTFESEIAQHKMMSDIFPVLFVLVALLIMMTTMTRMINSQRTQIGTLKALGFRKNRVTRHYMAYGFWLTFPGALLGVVIGPLTLPYLFYPSMSGFYTLPSWKPAYSASFFIMAAAMVFVCVFAVYLVSRRLLRETPANSLRPKSPKAVKHGFLERTKLWQKLGFNIQWNVRDTARNKVRSVMAVIGVFGCAMLLICAFGMNNSSMDLKEWQYEQLFQFESKLIVGDTASEEDIQNAAEAVNGELLMEGAVEIRANGVKKAGSLTVTADDNTLIQFTDNRLSIVSLPTDGISLTAKMARTLDISVGDTIEWHIYGDEKWTESAVAFIHREPTSQGVTMIKSHFESLGYTFRATSVLSSQKTGGEYNGITGVTSTSEITEGWDELVKQMNLMVYILIAAAALLSVVVLYNLGLLSFTEMEREMATLKVIGLKSRKLGRLLLTQNLWLSVVGFVLGVPAGLRFISLICESSGESFDFPVRLHMTNLLLSFCITFGLSILVNRLFSRKIKTLNMVEALKSME